MQQFISTLKLTILFLAGLILIGWTSANAFAQQRENKPATITKKKIIVKTIDENGEVQTKVLEREDAEIVFSKEQLFMCDLPQGMIGGGLKSDRNRQKKVIVLSEGESIPDHVKEEIKTMGVSLSEVEQKLELAKHSIRIFKAAGKNAIVEQDVLEEKEDFNVEHKFRSHPGFNPENLEEEIDIDFDAERKGLIHIDRNGEKRTMRFDPNNIPEELKIQMKEFGLDLDQMKEGRIWMDKDNGAFDLDEESFEMDMELEDVGDGKQRMYFFNNGEVPEDLKQKLREMGVDHEFKSCDKTEKWKGCESLGNNEKTVKPFLGVVTSQEDKGGVKVNRVMENSAAAETGIKEGDVIIAIDGKAVESTMELVKMIKSYEPGDQIKIKLKRNGKTKKVKPTLKAKEVRQHKSRSWKHCENPEFRVFKGSRPDFSPADCEQLCKTPMLGVLISDENGSVKGAKVNKIFENTGAKVAGLQYDDLITAIDNQPVESTNALIAEIQKHQPGDKVSVTINRDGEIQKINTELTNKAATRRYSNCDCSKPDFKKEIDRELIIIKQSAEPTIAPQEIDLIQPTPPRVTKPVIKRTLAVEAIALYPNPNTGQFTIDFTLEQVKPVHLTVVDVAGKEIYREEIVDFSGNYSGKIDVSRFAKGTYFLNIIQGEQVYTETFIYN